MTALTLDILNEASKVGGPASICEHAEMVPAAGPEGVVAPAKYTAGKRATYVFEKRIVDGELKCVVLIDAKTSNANRLEKTIVDAQKDNEGVLGTMPRIVVTYEKPDKGTTVYLDSQLPHRAFDGHIRIGTHEGKPMSEVPEYIAARNASLDDLWPLFELSPDTVMFGGWDSTRSRNQLRIASVLQGEVIGVLADQGDRDPSIHRAGARVDPVEASVTFSDRKERQNIVAQAINLSKKTEADFLKNGKGSQIGLGAIPPQATDDVLDGVAISKAVRMEVLSFSTLRTFRFGKGREGDEAIRALIAAALLRALAGYAADPVLRSNCNLSETGPSVLTLDRGAGNREQLEPLTVDAAEELLRQAYEQAHEKAGVVWERQTFDVTGNPEVINHGSADEEQD